jgi:hypothetical protein
VLVLLHLADRVVRPSAQLKLPLWFWVPVLGLLFYFAIIRHFFQIWHMSTFLVLCMMTVARALADTPRSVRTAVLVALAGGSLWATHNGFYGPGYGDIGGARMVATENRPPSRVGHSDCGRWGYFNTRDEVVNLDGVVNNRVLKYIRAGRMCDYLFEQHFDSVIMEYDRFDFYHRSVPTVRAAEVPPREPPFPTLPGTVDRIMADGAAHDAILIEGWIAANDCDSAGTFPLLAFLDAEHEPLATFSGVRYGREDVVKVSGFELLRWCGCRFNLAREQVPAAARFVRLGVRSSKKVVWQVEVKDFALP